MRDLTKFVNKVINTKDVESKRAALVELIMESHGKKTTKKLAEFKANGLKHRKQLDAYAFNFMLSGEGLSVY